jgi:hypothetical protein
LCAGTLLCIDPSMATSAQSSCHLTLLRPLTLWLTLSCIEN